MVTNYTCERFIPGINGSVSVEHLHRYILARQLSSELDVLDIACGEGYGSALVAEVANSVVGVDIDLGTINEALSKYKAPNLSFIQGDCANIPHPNNSFDLVISFETIEHHDKQSEMLREIRRVLRPDGVILISSPNRPEFNRGRNEPYPYHVRELDYNEFNSLLCEEFKNVEFYGQKSTFGSLVITLHEQ